MHTLSTIKGMVIEGKKRGRALGYPTANVALKKHILSGIYISYATVKGEKLPSLTFIGEAKTFDEFNFQSETHILDFTDDIYGETIIVELLKKIRDNEKFITVENLIEKMKEDEKTAREFFKNDIE